MHSSSMSASKVPGWRKYTSFTLSIFPSPILFPRSTYQVLANFDLTLRLLDCPLLFGEGPRLPRLHINCLPLISSFRGLYLRTIPPPHVEPPKTLETLTSALLDSIIIRSKLWLPKSNPSR